jgi:hypothetical protein
MNIKKFYGHKKILLSNDKKIITILGEQLFAYFQSLPMDI